MAFVLVDILPLKPGASVDQAISYFDGLKDVFARHGLTRVDAPLKAEKMMRGDVPANLVNLFETSDPQVSMQGMMGDPDYQAKMPERDRIFDLENASVILTTRQ